jgi:bacterioferritin-associated ferredoxin
MAVFQQIAEAIRPFSKAAFVCHCYEVSEAVIRATIDENGAQSMEEVTLHTQAGSACTACHCRIRRMLAGLSPQCSPFELCSECGFNTTQCACKVA